MKRTTWTVRENRTRPVTKSPADVPLGAQAGTPLEDVASLFRRHVAAVTPTLIEEEGTAPRRNISLHQKHEGVTVACPRPPGCADSRASSPHTEDVDAKRAEAYADTVEEDREEQLEELPQEAHAYGVSQARNALGERCRTRLLNGAAIVQ